MNAFLLGAGRMNLLSCGTGMQDYIDATDAVSKIYMYTALLKPRGISSVTTMEATYTENLLHLYKRPDGCQIQRGRLLLQEKS